MPLRWYATRPLEARLDQESIMSKPTQGGKNGGNSSVQEAKGSKSSTTGNSSSGKGNSQSAAAPASTTGGSSKAGKSSSKSK
jgi:hypothetical protein